MVIGQKYVVSFYARVDTGTGSVGLSYYGSTAPNYFTAISNTAINSTGWTRVQGSFTAIDNKITFYITEGDTAADTHYYDGFMLEAVDYSTTVASSFAPPKGGDAILRDFNVDGSVGIGDITPDYNLDVAGTAGFDGLLTLTGSAANIALGSNYLSGDGGDEGISVDSSGNTTMSGTLTVTGAANAGHDADTTSFFGRAAVGYSGWADYASFSHHDLNGTTNYALLQSAAGDTFLNAASGKTIYFRTNNVDVMTMTSVGLIISASATTTGNLNVGAAAGGDSVVDMMTSGVRKWIFGTDVSNTNSFVVATSSLGTNDALILSNTTPRIYMPKVYTDNTTASGANMVIGSDGRIYYSTSARKYKTDINYSGVDGNLVYQLQPASFKDKNNGREYIGFIAEDVAALEPRLVDYNDAGEPNGLFYGNFTALLTEAVQDQKKLIDELIVKVDSLSVATSSTETTVEPLVVIDNPDIQTQTLVVNQAATFYGTLYVQGEAGFMHKVVFEDDIEVKGKIYASADQAGTAVIPANATSTEVAFEKEYEGVPKINITPQSKLNGSEYWISEKTSQGFRINLDPSLNQDFTFDWMALGVKGQGQPPVIDNLLISKTQVGLDEQVEFWVIASDPDTEAINLSYSWSVDPDIGSLTSTDGNRVYWTVTDAQANTDITVTIRVSDGSNTVSQSQTITLVINDDTENPTPVVILGCTDQTATNYNPSATQNDGSCLLAEPPSVVFGCTDQTATNYNSSANQDDGSCQFAQAVEEPTQEISTTDQPNSGVGGAEL